MTPDKGFEERRQSVRIVESLPFHIGHKDFDIEASSLNISSHGVMCRIDKDIPMMTQLNIGIAIPHSSDPGRRGKLRDFFAKGVVVRKERDPKTGVYLIAIFFSDVKPKDQKILHEFIHQQLQPRS